MMTATQTMEMYSFTLTTSRAAFQLMWEQTGASAGNGYVTNGTGSSSLPPLPTGKDLPPGVTCTDAISRTLHTLPPTQLLDILTQIKVLATNDPARATELFQQAPQLAYAVFQALLLMNLVSPEAISSVLDPGSAPAPAPATQPPPSMPYGSQAAPPAASYPPTMTSTPPVGAPAYAPPTQPPAVAYGAPAAAPAAPPAQNPDDLMAAVMSLPQATIDQLPPAEREQIMKLRAEFSRR
jgi:cleavage stimulation factor subunit 2